MRGDILEPCQGRKFITYEPVAGEKPSPRELNSLIRNLPRSNARYFEFMDFI